MNVAKQTKFLLTAFVLAVFCLTLVSSAALGKAEGRKAADDEAPQGAHAAGELVVTYKDGASKVKDGDLEAVAAVEEELPEIEAEVVGLEAAEPAEGVREEKLADLKQELERDPNVRSVEYNYERTVSYTADDPGLRDQWALGKAGFERAWSGERGAGAKIAILDTGISGGHPDLSSKISAQRDFIEDDRIADDANGHGTAVAGIAAARTDNGTGIAGACADCRLVVGKVMDGDGVGYDSDIAQAITWAVRNDADVINLSLGGRVESNILKQAVDYAAEEGVIVVAAAGNQGIGSREFPAAYPSVVAVSSTDRNDERAPSSNFGSWVDVAAPGVGIVSTVPGGYGLWSGTSMAAPHVAAQAALLSASGMDAERIRSNISKTAKDLGSNGPDPYYGAGRIDASGLARNDNPASGGGKDKEAGRASLANGSRTSTDSTPARSSSTKDSRNADRKGPSQTSQASKPANNDRGENTNEAAGDTTNGTANEAAKNASRAPTQLPDTGGPALFPIFGVALILLGAAFALRAFAPRPRPVRVKRRRG